MGAGLNLWDTAYVYGKGTLPIIGATKVHHIEDAAKAAKNLAEAAGADLYEIKPAVPCV